MSEFSDLFFNLRTMLDDPESPHSDLGAELDPNLVDRLSAYSAARNEPLPQTILTALQMFMFSTAEDAWRKYSAETESGEAPAPLDIILERFLAIALDPSRQRLLKGPAPDSVLNQFRRLGEEG
jgi:hypothetical protein